MLGTSYKEEDKVKPNTSIARGQCLMDYGKTMAKFKGS